MHVHSVPSKTSVILQICENGAPFAQRKYIIRLFHRKHSCTVLGLTELHACTTSMRWGLKDSTYCSSSSSSLASMETRAIRRAESCVQGREASHNTYNLALFTVSPTTKWGRLVHYLVTHSANITFGKPSEPGVQSDETIHPIVARVGYCC